MRQFGIGMLVVCVFGMGVVFAGGGVVHDSMGDRFEGKTSMANKIKNGEGTEEDHKKMLELARAMAKEKPKKGDASSWKEKTEALVAASELLASGKKDEGLAAYKKAVNCKACHNVHKGK